MSCVSERTFQAFKRESCFLIYFSLKILGIVVARLWNSDSQGLTEEENTTAGENHWFYIQFMIRPFYHHSWKMSGLFATVRDHRPSGFYIRLETFGVAEQYQSLLVSIWAIMQHKLRSFSFTFPIMCNPEIWSFYLQLKWQYQMCVAVV